MVIDTNIIIACLNAEPEAVIAVSAWKQEGRVLCISSISFAETLSAGALTENEERKIKMFLENFTSISFDNNIAEIAGFFRRTYKLEIPDAAIAATAFDMNVPLVSRDHQFRKISEITLVEI